MCGAGCEQHDGQVQELQELHPYAPRHSWLLHPHKVILNAAERFKLGNM